MPFYRLPGAESRRLLIRDLRDGHAGWPVRLALSLVSAAAILAVAMIWMGLLETMSGRLGEELIAITMGLAIAAWCGVLALLWWTFRRFQVVFKAALAVMATWAVVLPAGFVIDSMRLPGEGYLLAAVIFMGIAFSLGAIVLIAYGRRRVDPADRAIVHMRMICPECGYSLVGLSDCRCPECGAQYTIETLVEALGRGQVLAETAIRPSAPAPALQTEPEHDGPPELPMGVVTDQP